MAPPGYPAKYAIRARELAEANWSLTDIANILGREFGQRPSVPSVRRWIDPDYAETERFARARGGHLKPRQRRKMWRLVYDRMCELRFEAGLGATAIAKLLTHDFGADVTPEQVRHMTEGNVSERTMRRQLWPKGAES